MDRVTLSVQAREADKTAHQIRKEGNVPCVMYGNGVENQSFQCAHNVLYKAFATAGESTVVDLDIDGKSTPVLFHVVDFHPVTDAINHVDFYAVDLTKEVEANVPVHFEGVSPAVKDLGGVFITSHDHVTVRCLPTDLPHALTVDISSMEEYGSSVHVGDIVVPEKVVIVQAEDMLIASVQQPRQEKSAAEEAAEGAEGEAAEGAEGEKVEGEEKKEE